MVLGSTHFWGVKMPFIPRPVTLFIQSEKLLTLKTYLGVSIRWQIKGRKTCGLPNKTVLKLSSYAFKLQLLEKKKKKRKVYHCSSKQQISYKGQFLGLSSSINFVLNYAAFCTSNLTHQYSFITVGCQGPLQSEDSTGCWQTCTEMQCCPGLQLQSNFGWWVNTLEFGCLFFDHYWLIF